jgi:ParB-like nuclease domain
MSGHEVQADANLLSAFTMMIGGALGAAAPMTIVIIWICSWERFDVGALPPCCFSRWPGRPFPPTWSGRGYYVIAGAHRLAAARKLKWDTLECFYLKDCTADDAELVEIDENLIRAELTPAEAALHIGRRKAIYERQHPETKHGAVGNGRKKSSQVDNSTADRFTADTARKTGKSEAAIQRDAARAKRVERQHHRWWHHRGPRHPHPSLGHRRAWSCPTQPERR